MRARMSLDQQLIFCTVMFVGAMENWGLITYRETFVLVDENNTSASSRQLVAAAVGHEVAHQWFGNLVTMVRIMKSPCFVVELRL